jgi:hypothetical protein
MFPFQRKQNPTKKIFAASVISAAIAGFAGFLSHKDNRDKTVVQINKIGDNLKDFGQEAAQSAQKTYKDVSDKVVDMADQTFNRHPDVTVVNAVDKSIDKTADKAKEVVEDIQVKTTNNNPK